MSDMVENICENNCNVKKCSWVPFFRQLIICNAVWTIYFILGMTSGAPTVFIPQIRKQMNSTNSVSDEMESWLSSVIGYGGIPWVFILPLFTEFFGRKIPFIILCLNSLAAYIVFYCSKNTTMVLISEIMQGMAQTGAHSILPVIITEYTSMKYRGIFLTLKSASFFWGVWAANAIGTFYHWKVIGLLGLTCCIYLVTVIMWPESPYWLATKGRYEECKTSYHWLKGYDHESDKELKYLLNSQIEYQKEHEKADTNLKKRFKKFLKTILSQDFYKPMLLCILMMSLVHLSGKLAFSMYATQIIKKITQNEATAYRGMLVLDGVTVSSMYVGCLLANFLKRRTQLLVSSSLGVMFLLIMSLYLYLIKLTIIIENAIVSILLLILFSVTISCGPIIMSTSIYGELVPLRFKSSGMFVMGLFSDALMATVLKVSPYIFESYGIYNACLIFAISAALCILLLYKYLPETKDKSLEEIEHYFKNEPLQLIEECKDLVTDVDNGKLKALL